MEMLNALFKQFSHVSWSIYVRSSSLHITNDWDMKHPTQVFWILLYIIFPIQINYQSIKIHN